MRRCGALLGLLAASCTTANVAVSPRAFHNEPDAAVVERVRTRGDVDALMELLVRKPANEVSDMLRHAALPAAGSSVTPVPTPPRAGSLRFVHQLRGVAVPDGTVRVFYAIIDLVNERDSLGNKESWRTRLLTTSHNGNGWTPLRVLLDGHFEVGHLLPPTVDRSGRWHVVIDGFNNGTQPLFGTRPGFAQVLHFFSNDGETWSAAEPVIGGAAFRSVAAGGFSFGISGDAIIQWTSAEGSRPKYEHHASARNNGTWTDVPPYNTRRAEPETRIIDRCGVSPSAVAIDRFQIWGVNCGGTTFLLRKRDNVDEAAIVLQGSEEIHSPRSPDVFLANQRLTILTAAPDVVLVTLTANLTFLPFDAVRWMATAGVGFRGDDLERLAGIAVDRANVLARRGDPADAIVLLSHAAGGNQRAADRLDALCATSTDQVCADRAERRAELLCSGWPYAPECMERRKKRLDALCARTPQAKECIEYSFETHEARDPFLDAAFAYDSLRQRHRSVARRIAGRLFTATLRQFIAKEDIHALLGEAKSKRFFDETADLLRDPDPKVRYYAVLALHAEDPQRSVPYLIGMLTDRGEFVSTVPTDVNPGMPIRVSWAADVLRQDLSGADELDVKRVPLDEIGAPLALEHAAQRYYVTHWKLLVRNGDDAAYGRHVQWRPLAEATGIPLVELLHLVRDEPDKLPDRMTATLLPWKDSSVYKFGDPIHLTLVLRNVSGHERTVWLDFADTRIHDIHLIGPGGTELSREPYRGIQQIIPSTMRLLGQHDLYTTNDWLRSDSTALSVSLETMYALRARGDYVLRYTYRAPGEPPVSLRFWDGLSFVSEFRFRIE